jgi:hypothetical protein
MFSHFVILFLIRKFHDFAAVFNLQAPAQKRIAGRADWPAPSNFQKRQGAESRLKNESPSHSPLLV